MSDHLQITKQLCARQAKQTLIPHIYADFAIMFDACRQTKSGRSPFMIFQEQLRNVPYWTQRHLEEKVSKAQADNPKLDILANTAILCYAAQIASARNRALQDDDIKDVSLDRFLHECFIQASKRIASNPFLFSVDVDPEKLVGNRERAHSEIDQAIDDTIECFVPIEAILLKPALSNMTTLPVSIKSSGPKPPVRRHKSESSFTSWSDQNTDTTGSNEQRFFEIRDDYESIDERDQKQTTKGKNQELSTKDQRLPDDVSYVYVPSVIMEDSE